MTVRIQYASVVVLVLLALVAGSVVLAQDDDQQPVRGAVNVIVDSAFIQSDGAEVFVDELTTLDPGETLRTDETGTVLITWFYDGTETVVTQDSSVTLNDFSGTSDEVFVVDMTLNQGHLVAGLGGIAADLAQNGTFLVSTPEFDVVLKSGQMEVTVDADGASFVAVTQGSAEISVDGGEGVELAANDYFMGGMSGQLTEEGISPMLDGLCTASANTNLVVRMYPSENSQRLGGVPSGQALWVRAGTEGNLWLQIAYETDPLQTDLHNFGWVYGPATTLDEEGCGAIPRAVLDAQLYGGLGADEQGVLPETAPIEEASE